MRFETARAQGPARCADVGLVDDFEQLVNEFNDRDSDWWPFLHLRPKQEERMGHGLIALLALLYGVVLGGALDILGALAGLSVAREQPLVIPAAMCGALFIGYRLTFAWAWNRRAERLTALRRIREQGVAS